MDGILGLGLELENNLSEARGILPTSVIEYLVQRFTINGLFSVSGTLSAVSCAARLAHYGFHRSVNGLSLSKVNLSSVPAEHLASLASCVSRSVDIRNVSGCDLSPILDSLKCEWLTIVDQSLNTEETQALVLAMETGVENVRLEDVTLDIDALARYSGQGKCSKLSWDRSGLCDESDETMEDLFSCAQSRNWQVEKDYFGDLFILWTWSRNKVKEESRP